jgi:TPR repeat protein
MTANGTLNQTSTKSPAANIIKYLLVIASLVLVATVLADDKQAVIDECDLKDTYEHTLAFPFCKKAAEQGDATSQFSLGLMFRNGEGIPQDDKQAVYWYTKSAKQGHAHAQYNLGQMFRKGEGTAKDDKQAVYWYIQAAEQEDILAQYNLGVMFDNGEGIPQDDKQAVYWYTKSAKQGYVLAQYNLGLMFHKGEGTPKDNVMAYVWWNIVAGQVDDEDAKKNKDLIEKEMTPSQIAEAQKLSREYYTKYVK